jgi:hypothetical protein
MTQTPEQIARSLTLALALIATLAGCAQKRACVGGVLYYDDGSGVYIRDERARTCVTLEEKNNG